MTLRERGKALLVEEKRWETEKKIIERENKIKKEKMELKADVRRVREKTSMSKLLIMFLFINCTLIELFTAWVTVQSFALAELMMSPPDFTPLVTLIGTIVGEAISYAVYSLKSARENTVGGIVYETAMSKIENQSDDTPQG